MDVYWAQLDRWVSVLYDPGIMVRRLSFDGIDLAKYREKR